MSGSLADELGYLPDLNRFQIDQNKISGEIPKTFSNLNRIRHMWVLIWLPLSDAMNSELFYFLFDFTYDISTATSITIRWVVKFLTSFPTCPLFFTCKLTREILLSCLFNMQTCIISVEARRAKLLKMVCFC